MNPSSRSIFRLLILVTVLLIVLAVIWWAAADPLFLPCMNNEWGDCLVALRARGLKITLIAFILILTGLLLWPPVQQYITSLLSHWLDPNMSQNQSSQGGTRKTMSTGMDILKAVNTHTPGPNDWATASDIRKALRLSEDDLYMESLRLKKEGLLELDGIDPSSFLLKLTYKAKQLLK